jgi:hypothetical protein
MNYWEILLIKQRERGRDGLTLPFIIGSQKYLPETVSHQNIDDLINDIISSKSFETCIRFCMSTQTFIFEKRKPKNVCYYPTYNNQAQNRLSVGVYFEAELGNSIELLIIKLKEKFQNAIDKELFSAEPDVDGRSVNWRPFSADEDIMFIKNCFEFL